MFNLGTSVREFFRRHTAAGILLGVDDAEDALVARLAKAEAQPPQPRTVIETMREQSHGETL